MRKTTVFIFTTIISVCTYAQVQVDASPESKAIVEVKSEFLGVQFPRLTSQEIKQIKQPEEGLLIYNLTEQCLCINIGKTQPDWKCLTMYEPVEQ